ncbi:MAG: hypothetical protein AAGC67_17080 [Myxococcota bacterium]
MTLSNRIGRRAVALVLALLVGLGASLALAETEEELQAKRLQWQDRYRVALTNRVILQGNVDMLLNSYAQAQRRNYPRGGAREKFLTQANEQKALLAEVEEEIASIYDEARAAGVPPGWLAEVESEDLSVPASPSSDDADEADAADREGRNPRFFEDDE